MDQFQNPLVTIITVSFNSASTIRDTLDSVLNQTYSGLQYVVIDGGSSDGTMEIVRSYASAFERKGIDFEYVSESDRGIYDAMNKGISRSRGSLIGVLNSDDWYETDTVAKVVGFYKLNGDADIVYGIVRETRGMTEFGLRFVNDHFLHIETINHPGSFITKDAYSRIGLYSLKYKYVSDYELFLRAKRRGLVFRPLYAILCNFRLGGATSNWRSGQERCSLLFENGLISTKDFLIQKLRGIFRALIGS